MPNKKYRTASIPIYATACTGTILSYRLLPSHFVVTMPSSRPKTVAIFGATGGTGLASLKLALNAGHTVNALARTHSKLAELSSQHPNLHVIQGDSNDIRIIKSALVINNRVVNVVVAAIGMAIEMKGLSITLTRLGFVKMQREPSSPLSLRLRVRRALMYLLASRNSCS